MIGRHAEEEVARRLRHLSGIKSNKLSERADECSMRLRKRLPTYTWLLMNRAKLYCVACRAICFYINDREIAAAKISAETMAMEGER